MGISFSLSARVCVLTLFVFAAFTVSSIVWIRVVSFFEVCSSCVLVLLLLLL